MPDLRPLHGGTDSLPDPRYDFSSNANPLGPCPPVLAALRNTDFTRYPDPLYTRLREVLAAHHGIAADRVVVGAGASELICRLIRCTDGDVQQLSPTFSEYARAARLAGRRVFSAHSPAAFLRAQVKHPGVGFVCWPNNPTGELWPLEFVAAASAAGPLVVDMAYASLCGPEHAAAIEAAAKHAYRLYSPNKAYGVTGVRGAYLIAPRLHRHLSTAAPSWVIGRDAVTFLETAIQPESRQWLARGLPELTRWRTRLADSLLQLGLPVRASPASFLMTQVGDASRVTAHLRRRDLRVRDASSFGLHQWIRLSAQAPAAQKALIAALRGAF
jgi:histidinol-phosphate aminotransferase